MNSVDPHFKKDFEKRLDSWISKQGVWFQLRHATSFNDVAKGVFDLFARVIILLILAVVGMWFYLKDQVSTPAYHDKLEAAVLENMEASSGTVGGVHRAKVNVISADLKLADIELNGSEKSFFEEGTEEEPGLTALGVTLLPLGILDGTFSGWSGKALKIEDLDIKLKSGAETDALAKASYEQLFRKYENLKVKDIEVGKANISWGYTEATKGSILGARVSAQYGREGWRIRISGGKFSYGFIRDADIEKMMVVCDSEGVHVEEAKLNTGDDGYITFKADLTVEANPKISGEITISHLNLERVLSAHQLQWLNGYISGEGKLSGYTYDGLGPEFDLNILLQRKDEIALQGRFPILASLELVDTLNSYQRVKLNVGGFKLAKHGGGLKLSDINLRAGILVSLTGEMHITDKHREAVKEYVGSVGSLMGGAGAEEAWRPQPTEDEVISLADAVKAGEALEEESREVVVLPGGMQKYVTGEIELSLKESVFDKLTVLRDEFRMNEKRTRYLIVLELDSFMENIGKSVADKMNTIQKASLEADNE